MKQSPRNTFSALRADQTYLLHVTPSRSW